MTVEGHRLIRSSPEAALVDLAGHGPTGRAECDEYVQHWLTWSGRAFPSAHSSQVTIRAWKIAIPAAAVIDVADDHLAAVGPKGRNMLLKCARHGYRFLPFRYNDELDSIHAINVSKPVRSGGPMRDAYKQIPTPIADAADPCILHRKSWLGAYDSDGVLKAYCALALVNELAVIDTILGHGDALSGGVMNGLVAYIVRFCRDLGFVRFVNYLHMETAPSLAAHKRSVGFVERSLVVTG